MNEVLYKIRFQTEFLTEGYIFQTAQGNARQYRYGNVLKNRPSNPERMEPRP